jgi:hypothetical protein
MGEKEPLQNDPYSLRFRSKKNHDKIGPTLGRSEVEVKMKEANDPSPLQIQVILPATSKDEISNGLRELTRVIVERNPDRYVVGLLGGLYGYGARWDDEIFSMHPFCWCDSEDCPWCEGDAPNFHHKETGFKIWWYKYIGRGMRVEGFYDWPKALAECFATVSEGSH